MDTNKLKKRIQTVASMLDERQKRIYLAAEAEALGWGGKGIVSEIAGVDKNTLTAGQKDLNLFREGDLEGDSFRVKDLDGANGDGYVRVRNKGGGRKTIEEKQPGITQALLRLVDGNSYGNPENPLSWTTKSTRKLAEELCKEGFSISHMKVKTLLEQEGYTLQSNRKLEQVGNAHPDRNEQFIHINETSLRYMEHDQPVISIDCKKKENIGKFANKGEEYSKSGKPVVVLDHDFYDREKGKAIPYGTYDVANNEGFVNVGVSHDTASFAVNSIYAWWNEMGKERYPDAKKLYITADGGGSNGSRNRLWKVELQSFANRTGLSVEVSHFPPGTSKWNKIEHRLFSYISKNWRGRPLETLEIIVNLIGSTTTSKGLKVKCGIDTMNYETGIKVSDEELSEVNIIRNDFHGEWNYIILPNNIS